MPIVKMKKNVDCLLQNLVRIKFSHQSLIFLCLLGASSPKVNIIAYTKAARLRWFGHHERMLAYSAGNRAYMTRPRGRQPVGQPKYRQRDKRRKTSASCTQETGRRSHYTGRVGAKSHYGSFSRRSKFNRRETSNLIGDSHRRPWIFVTLEELILRALFFFKNSMLYRKESILASNIKHCHSVDFCFYYVLFGTPSSIYYIQQSLYYKIHLAQGQNCIGSTKTFTNQLLNKLHFDFTPKGFGSNHSVMKFIEQILGVD